MAEIFVNLKRFEVPRQFGGLCPVDDPVAWIQFVIGDTLRLGLGNLENVKITYLLAESLIPAARRTLANETQNIRIGCQGVHWDDVSPGGNFGAFTSLLPAAAAKNLGCTWAIIGHSEERKAKFQVMQAYDPTIEQNDQARVQAAAAVDRLVNAEVLCALEAGLNVLLCVGETAAERGEGRPEEQKRRVREVLKEQLLANLAGVEEFLESRQIVIGYEPIWAIGPGKTPPGKEYISFVSAYIKDVVRVNSGLDPVVVYGGGLKEENAAIIASIDTIGGGLVALTRFTGDIGFDVEGLKRIVEKYQA